MGWLTSTKEERRARYEARNAEIKAKHDERMAAIHTEDAQATERHKANMDKPRSSSPKPSTPSVRRFNDELEDWKIRNGRLKKGLGKDYDLTDATATLDDSTTLTKRTTGTRVIAGATLAGLATGGLGAIAGGVIGGAAKKKGSKTTLYVTITLNSGDTVIIDTPAKNEKAARRFVANINGAAHNA